MSAKMFVIYKNPSNQYESFVERFSLRERKKRSAYVKDWYCKKSNSILEGRKPEQETWKVGTMSNASGSGKTVCALRHILHTILRYHRFCRLFLLEFSFQLYLTAFFCLLGLFIKTLSYQLEDILRKKCPWKNRLKWNMSYTVLLFL